MYVSICCLATYLLLSAFMHVEQRITYLCYLLYDRVVRLNKLVVSGNMAKK